MTEMFDVTYSDCFPGPVLTAARPISVNQGNSSFVLCSVLRIPFPRSPFDVITICCTDRNNLRDLCLHDLAPERQRNYDCEGCRVGRGADQGDFIKLKYSEKRKSYT